MTEENPKIDVLSIHETVSEFIGVRHILCKFKTALCPDRCGHCADVYTFKVLEYTKYEKPGEYGDDQQKELHINIKEHVFGQDPSILEKCKHLEEGKKYRVCYKHLYVDDGSNARPERPFTEISPIN